MVGIDYEDWFKDEAFKQVIWLKAVVGLIMCKGIKIFLIILFYLNLTEITTLYFSQTYIFTYFVLN